MIDSPIKVPSTLVPVRGFDLLIPNAAIAEVTILDNLISDPALPAWIVGFIKYHNKPVKVINFESLATKQKSGLSPKPAIVILKNILPDRAPAYFGLLATHIPSLVQANSKSIRKDLNPEKLHPFAASYARINDKPVIIPDLKRIIDNLQ